VSDKTFKFGNLTASIKGATSELEKFTNQALKAGSATDKLIYGNNQGEKFSPNQSQYRKNIGIAVKDPSLSPQERIRHLEQLARNNPLMRVGPESVQQYGSYSLLNKEGQVSALSQAEKIKKRLDTADRTLIQKNQQGASRQERMLRKTQEARERLFDLGSISSSKSDYSAYSSRMAMERKQQKQATSQSAVHERLIAADSRSLSKSDAESYSMRDAMERKQNQERGRKADGLHKLYSLEDRSRSRDDWRHLGDIESEAKKAEREKSNNALQENKSLQKNQSFGDLSSFFSAQDERDPSKRLNMLSELKQGRIGVQDRQTLQIDRAINKTRNEITDTGIMGNVKDIMAGASGSPLARQSALGQLSNLSEQAKEQKAGTQVLKTIDSSIKRLVKQSEKEGSALSTMRSHRERERAEAQHPVLSRVMPGASMGQLQAIRQAGGSAAIAGLALANTWNEHQRQELTTTRDTFGNISDYQAAQQQRFMGGLSDLSGRGVMDRYGDLVLGSRTTNAGALGLGTTGRKAAEDLARKETAQTRQQEARDAALRSGLEFAAGLGAIGGGIGALASGHVALGFAGIGAGVGLMSDSVSNVLSNRAAASHGLFGRNQQERAMTSYEKDALGMTNQYTERALAMRQVESAAIDQSFKTKDIERGRVAMVGNAAVRTDYGRATEVLSRSLSSGRELSEQGKSLRSKLPKGSAEKEWSWKTGGYINKSTELSNWQKLKNTLGFGETEAPPKASDGYKGSLNTGISVDEFTATQNSIKKGVAALDGSRAGRASRLGMESGEFDTLTDRLGMAGGVGAKTDISGARTENLVKMSRSGLGSTEQLLSNVSGISRLGGTRTNADKELEKVMTSAVSAGFNKSQLAQSFVASAQTFASSMGLVSVAGAGATLATSAMVSGSGERGLAEAQKGAQDMDQAGKTNPFIKAMQDIGLGRAAVRGGAGGFNAAATLGNLPFAKKMEVMKEIEDSKGDFSKINSSEARAVYADLYRESGGSKEETMKSFKNMNSGFKDDALSGFFGGNVDVVKKRFSSELKALTEGKKPTMSQVDLALKTATGGQWLQGTTVAGQQAAGLALMEGSALDGLIDPNDVAKYKKQISGSNTRYDGLNAMNVAKTSNLNAVGALGGSLLDRSLLSDLDGAKGALENSTVGRAIKGGLELPGMDSKKTTKMLSDPVVQARVLEYGKKYSGLSGKAKEDFLNDGDAEKRLGANLSETSVKGTVLAAEKQGMGLKGTETQMVQMSPGSIELLGAEIATQFTRLTGSKTLGK